jgi:hypothetical protein
MEFLARQCWLCIERHNIDLARISHGHARGRFWNVNFLSRIEAQRGVALVAQTSVCVLFSSPSANQNHTG